MLNKEDLLARRDDLYARREELMERATEIREKFEDAVNEDTVTTAVGWTLVSGGLAFGVTQWLRGRRGIVALLLPLAFVASGVALLTGGFAHRRGRHIAEVEDDIRRSLASLDPVARWQVLGHVGREAAPFATHSEN